MGVRRLSALINNLPTDSAYAREVDKDVIWDLEAHLLARVYEKLDEVGWRISKMFGYQLPKKYEPAIDRIQRPGVVLERRAMKRPATTQDLLELFGPPMTGASVA